jgi:endonuclease/exonuclease/phosphatase family metal-dependent hydrolase
MIGAALALAGVLLLVGLLLWAGGGKTVHEQRGGGIIEAIPEALEDTPSTPEVLVLLSYSMAYGLGSQGAGQARADAAAVYDRLDQIIENIAASGAEIVLLQEVDFASQRTGDIDQLHYIAAALGWRFAARAMTWECRYLPVPLWAPWRHAGRIRAGQGVISRYPLIENTRQRLPQSSAHPLWTPLFAPYHTVQMVDVLCGAHTVRLFNVHLEAHDVRTRQQQAHALVTFIRQMATPNCVIMGAFNSAVANPSEAESLQDHTIEIICTGLRDRVRLAVGTASPPPIVVPGVRLEPVLVGPGLRALETRRLPIETLATAHVPLTVSLCWALLPGAMPDSNHQFHIL